MAGRPPKPTRLKLVTNFPSHSTPINLKEPMPDPGIPEPPASLRPSARKYWDSLCKTIDDMSILAISDGEAVARMAEARDDIDTYQLMLDLNGGPVYEKQGRDGVRLLIRPEYYLLRDAKKDFHEYMREFGLTPSARVKLQVIADEKGKKPKKTGTGGGFFD